MRRNHRDRSGRSVDLEPQGGRSACELVLVERLGQEMKSDCSLYWRRCPFRLPLEVDLRFVQVGCRRRKAAFDRSGLEER